MQSIHIHVGAPKTGTSALQKLLSRAQHDLLKNDLGFLGPFALRRTGFYRQFWTYYNDRSALPLRDAVRQHFDDLLQLRFDAPPNGLILSEESFTHDLMPSRRAPGGFVKIEETFRFIELLPASDIKVTLTVRRQDSFLRSAYCHMVHRHGETLTFAEWIQRIVELESLSWSRIADVACRHFGRENVSVLPYEMLGETGLADFASACFRGSLDKEWFKSDRKIHLNRSLGRKGVALAMRVNTTISKPRIRNKLNSAIIGILNERPNVPDVRAVSDFLSDRFGDENRHLRQEFFPDFGSGFEFSR